MLLKYGRVVDSVVVGRKTPLNKLTGVVAAISGVVGVALYFVAETSLMVLIIAISLLIGEASYFLSPTQLPARELDRRIRYFLAAIVAVVFPSIALFIAVINATLYFMIAWLAVSLAFFVNRIVQRMTSRKAK